MTRKPELISVILPVYRNAGQLPLLIDRITSVFNTLPHEHEIIAVVDGSPDNSWEVLKNVATRDKRIKGALFSRNFGQHIALTAGLDLAAGDYVVAMDADLEDPPETIPALLERLQQGFDVVLVKRKSRFAPLHTKVLSRLYYHIYNYFCDIEVDEDVGTYRIMTRQFVDSLRTLRECNRFFTGLSHWIGYRRDYIEIEKEQRPSGRSSYNFWKRLKLGLDGIIAFSDKPLKISIGIGAVLCTFSLLAGVYYLVNAIVSGYGVPGWASLIVSIFFLSGVLLMNLGIMGLYVGKIFEEVKGRPIYIIRDTLNERADPDFRFFSAPDSGRKLVRQGRDR